MAENKIEIIRHSTAHLIAAAVLELFPNAKFGVGPTVENGFYYDFDLPRSLTPEDLPKIDKMARQILKKNIKFVCQELDINEAIGLFQKADQPYKIELLNDIKKFGTTDVNKQTEIKEPSNNKVSIYTLGRFVDLCRGPHISSTQSLGAFKLTKIAGAYWRGDEKNKMLQRIYGVAFENQQELSDYLKLQEEAEKRDHRKLGKELDLFSMHDEAPGMPFFHPKGAIIYNKLKNFWLEAQKEFKYDIIICPSMLDVSIWKQSGHWDHYKDDMYFIKADENKTFALRPMDCPGAILIYNNSLKSYRDLPIRYAEPGLITRKEKSGQLAGLFRVQQFVQDDAHMFITEDQIESEIKDVIKLVKKIYQPFGLEYKAYLSTRPDDFMGDIKIWDKAEISLKKILKDVYGDDYGLKEKDGAFYGPKIDFQLKDSLGRTWQCATIQLDFQMPLKFNCKYIDNDGKEKTPVMIHRTIMGSFERFMGILLEHYAGALPVWLSPVQVYITPIGKNHFKASQKIAKELESFDISVLFDDSNETIGYKVRKAEKQKIPYILIIGDKEIKSKKLNVRMRGNIVKNMAKKKFIDKVLKEIKDKK
ncbi:MAG: threonine--tRNA ligase [Patescibacteria group bacterium]|jgi:threonyl-tRNA synthetase